MPRASICIPTYNSARFLGETIESALAQTFGDFELVISDNASTDETEGLCARFKDPRIRYHRFETLVTQGGNWNRCVTLAKGDFVALLHADDIYGPEFLDTRMRQFEASPHANLAFGAVELIDANGKHLGSQALSEEAFETPAPMFLARLLDGCVISPAAPMVRRSAYERTAPFNEKRLWGIDWDMWLRLAEFGGVSYSPRIVSKYRIHGSSGSATGLIGPRYLTEDLEVLNEALRRIDGDPSLSPLRAKKAEAIRAYSLRAMSAAGVTCEANERTAALRALSVAVAHTPSLVARPTVWALLAGALIHPSIYKAWKTVRA